MSAATPIPRKNIATRTFLSLNNGFTTKFMYKRKKFYTRKFSFIFKSSNTFKIESPFSHKFETFCSIIDVWTKMFYVTTSLLFHAFTLNLPKTKQIKNV